MDFGQGGGVVAVGQWQSCRANSLPPSATQAGSRPTAGVQRASWGYTRGPPALHRDGHQGTLSPFLAGPADSE